MGPGCLRNECHGLIGAKQSRDDANLKASAQQDGYMNIIKAQFGFMSVQCF